jgi:cobalt-zinc-cadmium efflux system membrane fusion protein
MNALKQLLFLITAILFVIACTNKQESAELESNLIKITKQQLETDSIQLGKIITKTFESTINCNGSIVPLPNGIANVNVPVAGVIKNIYCNNGQLVEKNQSLLEITGNEIIDIQKEFAEASALYKRLKKEYERIESLYNEKVTTEKEFILAESEYKTSKATYNGLKIKIDAIGFSISKIENGDFYSSYSIKAPIKGNISSLNAHIGSYIDTKTELIDIIDPAMFQLKLFVFAGDLTNLKKGQSVRFKSVNSNIVHYATISSIGVAIDNVSKSIACYAALSDKTLLNRIANDFVESEIITGIDTVTALPSAAIIKNEDKNYILVLNKKENENYYFDKVEVKIGRQHQGFSEIPEAKIEGEIIVKGVYNISL